MRTSSRGRGSLTSTMHFSKRAEKPSQDAGIKNDGSSPPVKSPPSGEAHEAKNEISLARTKTEDIVYPSGLRLALLLASVFISSMYLPAPWWLIALQCLSGNC
jgi:hypothetical protein